MPVNIKLSTTLRDSYPGYAPAAGITLDYCPGMTVNDVALALNLPPDQIKIIMVNGRHSDFGQVLADEDRVAFFPAVGGG